MTRYQEDIDAVQALKAEHGSPWNAIDPEAAARMRAAASGSMAFQGEPCSAFSA